MSIDVVHYTDPGCPWAYSTEPFVRALEWRYGDGLNWRTCLIGLAEDPQRYANITAGDLLLACPTGEGNRLVLEHDGGCGGLEVQSLTTALSLMSYLVRFQSAFILVVLL